MDRKLLLIFTKNPVLGKVKTRLAKSIGDKKALLVFSKLIEKTATTIKKIAVHKSVYYSDYIDKNDIWDACVSDKKVQLGSSLGERMAHAFEENFSLGFNKIVIIGTDLWDIDTNDIDTAFEALDSSDGVIGPALDGGYYLLGLSKWVPEVFQNKAWGTSSVLKDTLQDFEGRNSILLEAKNDIDYEQDLRTFPELLKLIEE